MGSIAVLEHEAGAVLHDNTFLLTVLSSVFAASGVSLIAPALPALADGMGVSAARIGLLITAFTLPGIVVLPLSGYLSDTFGRNQVMAVGSLLIGVGGLLAVTVSGFWAVVLFRAVQGVGYAGVMPITVALIGDRYHGARETTAQGLRTAFNKVGGVVWMVLGGVLAATAWQHVFLFYTIFIPLAALLYLVVPQGGGNQRSVSSYVHDMVAVVEEPKIGMYLSIGFVRFFLKYGILTALPLLLASRFGLSTTMIGVYLAVMGAGGILSAAAAGAINAWFRKTSSVFVALIVIGAASVVIGMTHSLALLVAMVLVIGVADAGMSPLHKSLLTHNVDSDHRAGIITTNSLGQTCGKTLAPAVFGAALFLGVGSLFFTMGVAAVMSGAGYMYLRSFLAARNQYP